MIFCPINSFNQAIYYLMSGFGIICMNFAFIMADHFLKDAQTQMVYYY